MIALIALIILFPAAAVTLLVAMTKGAGAFIGGLIGGLSNVVADKSFLDGFKRRSTFRSVDRSIVWRN